MIFEGRVFKFADDINTDYIISGKRKFSISDIKELCKYLFEDIRPGFYEAVKNTQSIIVAGKNFGCGSSREQAPLVIKEVGIKCIIAKSFARIFYRNAFNVGLALIECDTDLISEGDFLRVDLEKGLIFNQTQNSQIKFKELPNFMEKILKEGGLINLIKKYEGWPQI